MSKMSDIVLEIQERLGKGEDVLTVAKRLCVPIEWVYTVENEYIKPKQNFSPFNTVNS